MSKGTIRKDGKMGKVYDLEEARRKAGERAKEPPPAPDKTEPENPGKQPSPKLKQLLKERLLLKEALNWLQEVRSRAEEVQGKE